MPVVQAPTRPIRSPPRGAPSPSKCLGPHRNLAERNIIKIKIHSSCEIEYFVETHLCKLCVNISLCGEKYVAKNRRQYTSVPQSLSDVMPFIVFAVIRTHASSHAFVELANNDQHRHWYAETCEHHPPPFSVDGAICHLDIDEEHQQRDSPSASEFLPSVHDECLKSILSRYKGRADTPPRVVIAQCDAITPGLRTMKSRHHSSNRRRC